MTGWLDGRRALVVGAGSGIGRAVVDAFRAEGAKVAVLERDSGKCDRLRRELPDVPVVDGDAVTREANDRAVAAAVDAFGELDTLVNCVGIFDFYKGVGDIDADALEAAFDEMFR
ncbi:MAG TPA: SDR family NAD(P)-dependent oxidoreductase, partial [Mycobacteriales bacterium]|nr:SDR family NAD(P)-dependent oxidoreductase [Mycobacteriales bacterium]